MTDPLTEATLARKRKDRAEMVADMPFEDYLAVEALSFSGIRWLMQSPLDFWTRCRWLNPNAEDEETKALMSGRAMHKRVVEGKEAFMASYAPTYQADDDHLVTADDIRNRLREIGQKPGGNKPELIARLLEVQPNAKVYDVMRSNYASTFRDKTLLPMETLAEIEYAAAMIERHPELSRAFEGGQPEVSIFWNLDGVPMKCRIDYLKPKAVVEYKTFSNSRRLPAGKAIAHAIAGEKYHLQAVVYNTALEALGEPERTWLWVFQQQGNVPLARGKVFPRGSLFDVGMVQMKEMVSLYKDCLKRFGSDPWVDMTPIETLDDLEVPVWATD